MEIFFYAAVAGCITLGGAIALITLINKITGGWLYEHNLLTGVVYLVGFFGSALIYLALTGTEF